MVWSGHHGHLGGHALGHVQPLSQGLLRGTLPFSAPFFLSCFALFCPTACPSFTFPVHATLPRPVLTPVLSCPVLSCPVLFVHVFSVLHFTTQYFHNLISSKSTCSVRASCVLPSPKLPCFLYLTQYFLVLSCLVHTSVLSCFVPHRPQVLSCSVLHHHALCRQDSQLSPTIQPGNSPPPPP